MSNESSDNSREATTTLSLAIKNDKNDLINHLHGLILFSIASIYYKDCLTIIFLVRTFSQIQLTTVGIRIAVAALIVSFLTHTLQSHPKTGNNGPDYGILVDFIGEPSTSRIGLLLLDLLVFSLQLLYLAILYKKPQGSPREQAEESRAEVAQDIDAEEQGISRRNPPHEGEDGIELQNLLPGGSEREKDIPEEESDTIVLRKKDLIDVFRNPAGTGQSAESADAWQNFIQRVNAVRARRAETEAAELRAAEAAANAARTRLEAQRLQQTTQPTVEAP